jgi:hypothetical protein
MVYDSANRHLFNLQRANTFQLSGITPFSNTVFDRTRRSDRSRPWKASGAFPVGERRGIAAGVPSNSLADLTSLAAQAFQNGVGVMARSADHAPVLVASNDNSGTAMVLTETELCRSRQNPSAPVQAWAQHAAPL